jgi:DNA-binding NarL/FixJ family response regulator
MYKVLLVDDHQVILDSLSLLLQGIHEIEVLATINDSTLVEPFLIQNHVDILISDFNMPKLSGVDLCLTLKTKFPYLKIILLTMVEDAPQIRDAIKAGVNGYILKKTGKEELERAILKVISGKKYFSDAIIEELAENHAEDYNNARPETILQLTDRELEILKLVALELSSQEIADKLYISLSTVETHRRNLFQKLEVKSVVGLTKYAIRHGLVQ